MPAAVPVRKVCKVNSAPAALGSFKLPCRKAGEVEAVLSVSMPARAIYPVAWIEAIQQLPEKHLVAMAEDKSRVTSAVIELCEKQNRRKWNKLVDAGKADAVKRGDSLDEEKHEARVLQRRWEWLNAQLKGLSQSKWFCDSAIN